MSGISKFEDLRAWQSARELANLVYDLSDDGPFARDFALKDQMRRASISVMRNIAEGFDSRTNPLFSLYLGRSKASAGEVRSQLYLALDRRYVLPAPFERAFDRADKVSRQIRSLQKHLDARRA